MRQREFILGAARGDASSCAGRCSISPIAIATRSSPCTRTRSARSRRRSRTTCWRSSSSSSATRRGCKGAYDRTNRNPLGACAITGTGFPIDRQLTSDLLGFCGPTGNTYGSIATVDYLLESASAAAVLLVGLGRFVQDLLLWCTAEFGYLRLRRRLRAVQQHHAAEAQSGRARARARDRQQGARPGAGDRASTVHNTPFGDIVDTEDDLQPLVFSMFRDATRAVKLVAAAMATAEFDAARLEARAGDGWTTLTELADTLVRDHGLPFRTAHAIAGRLIAARQREPERPLVGAARRRRRRAARRAARRTPTTALAEILSPRHFVEVRRTLGGPAPEETARARRRVARSSSTPIGAWWTQRDRRARRRPSAGSPSGAPRCERGPAKRDTPMTSDLRPRARARGRDHRRSLWCLRPCVFLDPRSLIA